MPILTANNNTLYLKIQVNIFLGRSFGGFNFKAGLFREKKSKFTYFSISVQLIIDDHRLGAKRSYQFNDGLMIFMAGVDFQTLSIVKMGG